MRGHQPPAAPDGDLVTLGPGSPEASRRHTLAAVSTDLPVRTYGAQRGRVSALTIERLATLGPARALPPGPVDPWGAFGRRAPLVLEVGCGQGAAAVAYAATHPDHDLVAVDVHRPGIARLLAAAEQADLPNLRVEIGDAVRLLDERLGPGQLEAVHLFFPDPWPKSRHVKRRFVSRRTLGLLDSRLAPEGYLLVSTDDPRYAAYVIEQVAAHGAFFARVGARPPWRPREGFEARALAAGRDCIELVVVRR